MATEKGEFKSHNTANAFKPIPLFHSLPLAIQFYRVHCKNEANIPPPYKFNTSTARNGLDQNLSPSSTSFSTKQPAFIAWQGILKMSAQAWQPEVVQSISRKPCIKKPKDCSQAGKAKMAEILEVYPPYSDSHAKVFSHLGSSTSDSSSGLKFFVTQEGSPSLMGHIKPQHFQAWINITERFCNPDFCSAQ